MDKKQVLLVFGGESSEHEVSLASAQNIAEAIDTERYSVKYCYIDQSGMWWLVDTVKKADTESEQLLPTLGGAYFTGSISKTVLQPQVIFPVLHGKNGEDGSVQGLAQLLHIPIVGCGVTASALGMDKVLSKELVAAQDIKIVPYMTHRTGEVVPEYDAIAHQLGEVVFVKPSRAGSSVGVNKVSNQAELITALTEAHQHDTVVLIETAMMPLRELEVAVYGTPPHQRVSSVGEVIPGAEFYSYSDKYDTTSTSQVAIPAQLEEEISRKIREDAQRIFATLECSGLARIDFFLATKNNEIYFNEINTLPGFTNISMYPKLWEYDGVSYSQLITELIEDCLLPS